MSKKTTHVMYDKDKGDWYVKDGGNSRASKRGFGTQKDAEDWGRSHSQKEGSELLTHRKDNNQIRKADSHGNDPCPPKDKK